MMFSKLLFCNQSVRIAASWATGVTLGLLLQGCGTTSTNDNASSSTSISEPTQTASSSSVSLSVSDFDGATSSLSAEPQSLEVTEGLVVHLDAAQLASGLVDGDLVSTWAFQDNAGSVDQTSPLRQPIWIASSINQLPAVRFDGVDDYLVFDQHYFSANLIAGSLFVVMQPDVASAEVLGAATQNVDDLTYAGFGLGLVNNKAFFKANNSGQGLWALATPMLNGGGAQVVAARYTAERAMILSPCTQILDGGASTPLGSSQSVIGGNLNAVNSFKGDIAEVVLYDRPLSNGELASVRSYLANKYALDITPLSNGVLNGCGRALATIPPSRQTVTIESANGLHMGSIDKISDLASLNDNDPHNNVSHIWAKGELVLRFEFQTATRIKGLHFWNHFDKNVQSTELYDVDLLEASFRDANGIELHSMSVSPKQGFGDIYAEDFFVDIANVKQVVVSLSGSNGETEFQNIAFSTSP